MERMNEDALVRLVDYCHEHGISFGKGLHTAVSQMTGSTTSGPNLYYATNERLADWINKWLDLQHKKSAGKAPAVSDAPPADPVRAEQAASQSQL